MILVVFGLCLFEVVSSFDNAVINADVLATMQAKWRKWFLIWGIFTSVFLVRGLLPWLIVWASAPSIGPWGALTATFSDNPVVKEAVERSSPLLLLGGGVFLVFLFFHWLFLEPKNFGLSMERFFQRHGGWFFTMASLILTATVWFALKQNPLMAFSACLGSSMFFISAILVTLILFNLLAIQLEIPTIIIIAFVSTITEALSKRGLDNITIPLAVLTCLVILS